MSGKKIKRITVSEDRLRELETAALRNTEYEKIIKRLIQNHAHDMNHIHNVQDKLQELEKENARLGNNIDKVESDFSQKLAGVVDHFNESLLAEVKRRENEIQQARNEFQEQLYTTQNVFETRLHATSEWLESMIEHNDQSIRRLVAETTNDLQNQINNVQQTVSGLQVQMDRINNGNDALLEQAKVFYEYAVNILGETTREFRTNLVPKEELDRVNEAINEALENIRLTNENPVNASVARKSGSDAFKKVLQYKQMIINAEQEWNQHYQAAMYTIQVTQAKLEASRTMIIEGTEIDVDYWSDGNLSSIDEKLSRMKDTLEQTEQASLEEIDSYNENTLRRSAEIDDTVRFSIAVEDISQQRYELSEELATKLGQQFGLVLVPLESGRTGAYESDDQRAAYRIHMRNPVTEFELVITQETVVEDGLPSISAKADVLHYSNNISMDEDEENIREVLNLLNPEGYERGEVMAPADNRHMRSDLKLDRRWDQKKETAPKVAKMPRRAVTRMQ